LLENLRISQAFDLVQDFNAGKATVSVIVRRDAFRQVLCGDRGFLKADVEGIRLAASGTPSLCLAMAF